MRTEALAAFAIDRPAAAATPREPVPWLPCGVRFVGDEGRRALLLEAAKCRFLVVDVESDDRRSLRDAVEEGVEVVLARRGALPPSTEVGAAPARVVRDQHARLRAASARGILIALPPLQDRIEDGALAVDDGAVLASWMRLALDDAAPTVVVAMREEDRSVPILVPRPLGAVVDEAERDGPHVAAAPVFVRVVPALAPTTLPPPVERGETAPPSSAVVDAGADVWAHADDVIASRATPIDLGSLEPPAVVEEPPSIVPGAWRHAEAPLDDEDDGGLGLHDSSAEAPAARPLRDLRDVFDEALRVDVAAPSRTAPTCDRPVERVVEDAQTTRSRERVAQRVASAAAWRQHAVELDAAKGPKPLSVVHELFSTHYVPLLGAMARGELDGTVRGVLEEWRQSFAQSYMNAFASMRVTGKRPTMVLDAPEMAARLGRSSGAKSVKLVLVDAMGWDLGKRVTARMQSALGTRASLLEQQVLWSALPTTTPTQTFFLARGPNGLRDQEPPASDPDVSRGRNVSSLRRERIGSRDVMKLDLVEARLRSPGDGYDERLEAIAEETAQVVGRYAETLPPRTLLYVFGDHGFVLPPGGSGFLTGPASQGGASPEEVLVGGFAWMIDSIH